MPVLVKGTKKTLQAGTSMPNQAWPLKELNKKKEPIGCARSNGFFTEISPTSSGFASRKKIRYDRENKRLRRAWIIKLSLSSVLFQPFFLCYNRGQ